MGTPCSGCGHQDNLFCALRVSVPTGLSPHFSPSLQGAGGVVTDWRGNELVWRPSAANGDGPSLEKGWVGEVCAAGDPELHKLAVEKLGFQ